LLCVDEALLGVAEEDEAEDGGGELGGAESGVSPQLVCGVSEAGFDFLDGHGVRLSLCCTY
jgi:hypothetical protein